jgi:serine/threonine-protein kinase
VTTPADAVGTTVAGKYRIDGVLGTGGMGVVYRATHLDLGSPVALKVLRVVALSEEEATRRFLREARATFALRSPHTVRVLDVSRFEGFGLTIVMEYLEGHTLSQLLRTRRTLEEVEAIDYAVQVCRALAEAHDKGIIHRDIKPGNLLITEDDQGPLVKVLDFGLAKAREDEAFSVALTDPSATLGTPRYMAPEQWLSAQDVDPRSDLYSLGVVLYQMLVGKVPLDDVPIHDRAQRLLVGVPSPRDLNPAVSEEISRVVLQVLRPVREERYASAREFEQALLAPPSSWRALTTTVGKAGPVVARPRDSAPSTETPSAHVPPLDEPPHTEREPGWDVPTTPRTRPPFEVNVYTGARIHEPTAQPPEMPRLDVSPNSVTDPSLPFALTRAAEQSPRAVHNKSTLRSATPTPTPTPPPTTTTPTPAPAATDRRAPPIQRPAGIPVASPGATPARRSPQSAASKASTLTARFFIALLVAFAIGMAFAFLLYR